MATENTQELDDDLHDEEQEVAQETQGQQAEAQVQGEEHDDEEEEATAKRDTELEEAANDAEREAIRERRREDRKRRKQWQREKIESLERALETERAERQRMAQQIASVQNATLGQSLNELDKRIAQAQQAANQWTNVAAEAIGKQDGNTWRQANANAEAAKQQLQQLTMLKANVVQNVNRQPAQALNPVVVEKATEFRKKHSWYRGPQSTDLDSAVLTQLDTALTKEGFDPSSDAYWGELEARVKKYLPHRSGQQTTNQNTQREGNRPRSPVAGSSSGTAPTGKSGYVLSPERVQALKDAGMWNDPKQRQAGIERYRKYDQEHGIK